MNSLGNANDHKGPKFNEKEMKEFDVQLNAISQVEWRARWGGKTKIQFKNNLTSQ